jgi:predicted dehydrogenase
MPFHIGIIGYGLSAKIFHIPYIQSVPELRLSAICQRRASPGNDAANDHPEAKIYRDPNELIRDPEVDVVILCLPPETHLTLGKQCLEAGKHSV